MRKINKLEHCEYYITFHTIAFKEIIISLLGFFISLLVFFITYGYDNVPKKKKKTFSSESKLACPVLNFLMHHSEKCQIKSLKFAFKFLIFILSAIGTKLLTRRADMNALQQRFLSKNPA